MTKISLIVLTYNHEKFIAENLTGLFMQVVDAEVEVIICDDHSPDNTDFEIKKAIQKAPKNFKIKYVRRAKNIGSTPNFYEALTLVTGNYVAFCEGDDFWTEPEKLQTQLNFLENNPSYSMCFHAAMNVADDPKINGTLFSKIMERDYSQLEIYRHWLVHTATVMMKAEVLKSAAKIATMQDNSLQYFDTVLFLAAGSIGKIHGSEKIMSAYRRHDAGLSAGKINFRRDLKHNKLDAIIGDYYKGELKKLADWQIFSRSFQDFQQAFRSLKWKSAVAFLPWLFRNRILFYYLLKKK